MYDANVGPEALPNQSSEFMPHAMTMEQATAPDAPVTEPFSDSRPAEVIVSDGYVGPGSETYAIHAKLGGKAAAEEIVELNRQGVNTSEGDSNEPNPGFMSKLSGFASEHPGLTFGMALGTVGAIGAVSAEVVSASSIDGGKKPAAKVGKKTPGEASTSAVQPCEDTVESSCSYPHPIPEPKPSDKPDKDQGNNGKPKQGNLLPVPEKKTRRHWATKIINELRKGKKGRISASPEAKKDLYQARRGQCSKAEQKPGACPKLDKTLLKVLYKASFFKGFYIWHFTSGPHVPNSHHWRGDGTDLRKRNGKAPTDKSMFPIIRRVAPRNKSLEMIGPGDDQYHTGKKDGHWHIAVY